MFARIINFLLDNLPEMAFYAVFAILLFSLAIAMLYKQFTKLNADDSKRAHDATTLAGIGLLILAVSYSIAMLIVYEGRPHWKTEFVREAAYVAGYVMILLGAMAATVSSFARR